MTNSLGMPFTHSLGIVLAGVDGQYLWLFKCTTQFFSQKMSILQDLISIWLAATTILDNTDTEEYYQHYKRFI